MSGRGLHITAVPARSSADKATTRSMRMRIVHDVSHARRRTRATNWCRGAIGIGVLSALSVAAVAAPAGADGSATTTTTPGTGATTTKPPSAGITPTTTPSATKVARSSKLALSSDENRPIPLRCRSTGRDRRLPRRPSRPG